MTRRIRVPGGHGVVTFGGGCNEQREVVEGHVVCPRGDDCSCFPHAVHAGYDLIAVADEPAADWRGLGREAARRGEPRKSPPGLHSRSREAREFLAGHDEVAGHAAAESADQA